MNKLTLTIALSLVSACVGQVESVGGPGAPDAGASDPAGGSGGNGGGSGSGSGSSGSGGGGGTIDAGSGSAAGPACKNIVTAGLSSGHHNPGQDCMNGCHNHGFTVAGTLYKAAGGALAGGTITVTDAAGATLDLVAGTNGNFYTSSAVTFPLTVYASACPTATPMVSTVASSGAGCNSCHTTGGQGHIAL